MTQREATNGSAETGGRYPAGLIDADLHCAVPGVEALFPYLPSYWVDHVRGSVFKGPSETYYPPNAPVAARPGSRPPAEPGAGTAPSPGSRLDLLVEQALEPLGVERAVLSCLYAIDGLHNPEAAAAFASAVNDWLIAEWLEREPRLRGSIVVPVQLPELAAREIDRVAAHPGFVQVLLPVRTEHPLGSRLFRPLWEAIARHDLVAGIHYGGVPGNPPFPSGWPSYFLEEYAGMAQVFQSQLTSIISEGVFDLYPNLRLALLESGFTWLPAFMWRFDKEWRNLRFLVPWVKRAPSEYMREHVRLSVLPLDAPPDPADLVRTIDQLGSDEMLLFATDYPHRHAADPLAALLPHLEAGLARRIASENARALYRLGDAPQSWGEVAPRPPRLGGDEGGHLLSEDLGVTSGPPAPRSEGVMGAGATALAGDAAAAGGGIRDDDDTGAGDARGAGQARDHRLRHP